MLVGYASLLATAQADGTALTNSTANTSIVPPQARYTIPAGFFQYVGQEVLMQASGRISTVITTPGTLTFQFVLGTVPITTQALALNVNAKTDVTWWLDLACTIRSVGSSGTIIYTGFFSSEAVVGSPTPGVGGSGTLLIPAVTPAPVGINTLNAAQLDFKAQWSVASPSNSIQLQQFRVWSPN